MSSTVCDARERSDKAVFYLMTSTEDMTERVAGILTEHEVAFERRGQGERRKGVIAIVGPQDHSRIAALLRHLLSEPERRAVSVFSGDGSQFPTPRLLDEWWRVHETAWFAKAFAEDRFVTWFQPIMDTAHHRVAGHECLIRLPYARAYSGAEILDAAWVRDEMHTFDAYARSLAIRSAARQSTHGAYFVNFMPSSIYNPELCLKSTLQTLQESGLQPRNIVFEVVESELVRDRAHLHRICDFYRNHGFGLALDDLGTAPDSMQLVRDMDPDFIKLHKNLIRNVEKPLYAATVRKLVELSDKRGISVVAKGVERAHDMENLWLLGVLYMQGYLFGRPGPDLAMPQTDLVRLAEAFHPVLDLAEQQAVPALAVN
jgi:EAL domain-containing protein (putative c-di-GMP-specific phosphodiesterase class I)